MTADIPYAVTLADYRADVVAELRRLGLAASAAIVLVRRDLDRIECGIECGVEPAHLAASLLVLLED